MFSHTVLAYAVACLQLSLAYREKFIVGGQIAKIRDFPYAAFLLVYVGEKGWICGSSILNQRILLTAGHCVFIRAPNYELSVNVGSESRRTGAHYAVDDFLTHEDFGDNTLENDLALLRVRIPIKFGPKVSRIGLMRHPPRDVSAYVAGWGLVNEIYGVSTDFIKSARQRVWNKHECEKKLGQLPDGVLCGGGMTTKGYAAPGDSGSALVMRRLVQVGLVSFKKPAISDSLVVYTDVAHHYNWIVFYSKRMHCKVEWTRGNV